MEKSLHTFDKKFLKSNIRDVLSGWDLIEFRVCNKGDDIYKLDCVSTIPNAEEPNAGSIPIDF